jgi:hypothetical protein
VDDEAPERELGAELVKWLRRYNLLGVEWCRGWLGETLQYFHFRALRYPAEPPDVEIEYIFMVHQWLGPTMPPLEWNPTRIDSDAELGSRHREDA